MATFYRNADGGPSITATRLGDLLVSSTIRGLDPATGALGLTAEMQFDLAFANVRSLLRESGLSVDDLALVTAFINDASYRPLINRPWLQMFPDENRPARKTTHNPLPDGVYVELQFLAAGGGARQPVSVPGLGHRDPLPLGVRIGDHVFSSVVTGDDPSGGPRPEGRAQIDQAFRNMRSIVEAAGGAPDDVNLVWVYLGDFAYQAAMVESWLEVFPTDGNRPARKTFPYDLGGGANLMQLQFTASIGGGKRANFEVPGIGHEDPIPLGSTKAGLLQTSGITGVDPSTGHLRSGASDQASQALGNLSRLVAIAGGSNADLLSVTALVSNPDARRPLIDAWHDVFPVATDRPAFHIMSIGLQGRATEVQVHGCALIGG
jgi:2-iminobutanoate/2-iminopropanoate deaminase